MSEIAQVAVRHGFGYWLETHKLTDLLPWPRPQATLDAEPSPTQRGRHLREMLDELGPTFVKFGQLLSTRPDIVPPDIITELRALQDDVTPFAFAEVERVVREELELPIEKLFTSFEETPMAAASIGQVHRAVLPNGRRVAVKVQRPRAPQQVESDIQLLYQAAKLLREVDVVNPVLIASGQDTIRTDNPSDCGLDEPATQGEANGRLAEFREQGGDREGAAPSPGNRRLRSPLAGAGQAGGTSSQLLLDAARAAARRSVGYVGPGGHGPAPGVWDAQAGAVQAAGNGLAGNPLHDLGPARRELQGRARVWGARNDLSPLARLGAIVVILAFWVEFRFNPPLWLHAVLWPVVTIPLAVLMMRPAKAALVALQFRHRASEMGL